ncbi:hypothetical protein [Cryptosporangium arvum]|uniref:Uncharacterized protein n=1 Tax=Cryptosporangium arvum DSM 44712 TaxID=927661 RepID=A0A011AIS8_9ACTN|nr:hypothetical protein [Cryptosporangium arvum]EXG81921.1 hypothetical protein CryarDRAFT_3046 [Cryptosporangium arvum DSM 44712]
MVQKLAIAATAVVALVALVTGMVALERSGDARRIAGVAADREPLPVPTVVAQQSIVPGPSVASLTPAPGRSRDRYPVAYENQHLRLQNACVGSGQAVDLDEPRVAPPDGAELTFFACTETRFAFEGPATFAEVTDPQANATACLDALRTNPGVESLRVARGQTVCVLTSGPAPRIVRMRTDSVTDRVALSVTAWTMV